MINYIIGIVEEKLMYQNYIFDLYGTLVDIRTDESSPLFWQSISNELKNTYDIQIDSLSLETLYHKLVEKEFDKIKNDYKNYTYYDINLENVFKSIFSSYNKQIDDTLINNFAVFFRQTSTKKLCLYDGVIDLLESLKRKEKNIFLLTNAQRCFTFYELQKLKLVDYFTSIQISSDLCCSKPDQKFFEFLFSKNNLKKEESIMIGNDYSTDINGANTFGIDSLYIHQSISPSIENIEINSKWKILDGNVYDIKKYILK